MKQKNRKIAFLSLIIILPVFVWSIFFFFSGSEADEVEVAIDNNEEEYPKYIGNEEDDPNIEAEATFSFYYNKEGKKVLYEKNKNEILPIASISKLMTAVVVLENYNLGEKTGVTEYDVISRTEFRDFRGWSDTEIEKMVYQMVIESNNSAAFAMALISDRFLEGNGEPVDNFVKAMNDKAGEIGLKKTQFVNPSGLDQREEYNYSTAEEIGLFARYIIENQEKIFNISKMPSYRLYSSDKLAYYEALNTNIFLQSEKNNWESKIIGGKTGWTRAAYGCLLIVLESPEKEGYIVNVVLGAEDRFKEMEKLINHVYSTYEF